MKPVTWGWPGRKNMEGRKRAELARYRDKSHGETQGAVSAEYHWFELGGPLILSMGTEEEKQKYIKGILSAEDIWCQGFSEPDHGSDLGNAQCRAVKDGDEYVINGSKIWTSLGSYAKYMILIARTSNEDSSKYAGLSFFLAPMDAEGVEPRPIKKLTGEYQGFCQTFFNDARIPATSLMGKEEEGWKVAMATSCLKEERLAARQAD